jgi:hypothetical protein
VADCLGLNFTTKGSVDTPSCDTIPLMGGRDFLLIKCHDTVFVLIGRIFSSLIRRVFPQWLTVPELIVKVARGVL